MPSTAPWSSSQRVGVEHGLRRGRIDAHAGHDLELFGGCGVSDDDLHEEPVALRLRQQVHTFGLDRVLRREHQERIGNEMRDARDRDLALGHHLEQRRLHLGGRTVDLVGEDEVGEDRAQLHVETLRGLAVDARADEVGRHEVGGELDAGERALDRGRERLGGERLREAGHALQEAMPPREQAHHESFDHAVLPDDDALDFEQGALEACRSLGDGGGIGGLERHGAPGKGGVSREILRRTTPKRFRDFQV